VDRGSRSSRVTTTTSLAATSKRSRRSCGPVGLGAARHFAEHLAAAGGSKLLNLGVNALAVRRDAGIAVNHGLILHQNSAPKKPNRFNALNSCGFLTFCTVRFGWKPDIRTRFLRKLSDCFGVAGTAVRNSWILLKNSGCAPPAHFQPLSGKQRFPEFNTYEKDFGCKSRPSDRDTDLDRIFQRYP
jgi:hypothetical protein